MQFVHNAFLALIPPTLPLQTIPCAHLVLQGHILLCKELPVPHFVQPVADVGQIRYKHTPVPLDQAPTPTYVSVYRDMPCQGAHVCPVPPVNTTNTQMAFANPVPSTHILLLLQPFPALHVTIVDAIQFILPCAQWVVAVTPARVLVRPDTLSTAIHRGYAWDVVLATSSLHAEFSLVANVPRGRLVIRLGCLHVFCVTLASIPQQQEPHQ